MKKLAAVVLNYRTPDDTLVAARGLLTSRRPVQDLIVVLRGAVIVGLGLVHALAKSDAPAVAGVANGVRGAWHHQCGRYGGD
jgi:hypothetical protein